MSSLFHERRSEGHIHAPSRFGRDQPQFLILNVDILPRQPGDVLETPARVETKQDDALPSELPHLTGDYPRCSTGSLKHHRRIGDHASNARNGSIFIEPGLR
jgi:hypothetical protein